MSENSANFGRVVPAQPVVFQSVMCIPMSLCNPSTRPEMRVLWTALSASRHEGLSKAACSSVNLHHKRVHESAAQEPPSYFLGGKLPAYSQDAGCSPMFAMVLSSVR